MSNWLKIVIALIVFLVLLLVPVTRTIILLVLPLGSGVDDLLFLIVLFAVIVLILMRAFATRDLLKKIASWLMK